MDLSLAVVVIGVCLALAFVMGRVYEAIRQRRLVGVLIEQDNLTREAWDQVNAGL